MTADPKPARATRITRLAQPAPASAAAESGLRPLWLVLALAAMALGMGSTWFKVYPLAFCLGTACLCAMLWGTGLERRLPASVWGLLSLACGGAALIWLRPYGWLLACCLALSGFLLWLAQRAAPGEQPLLAVPGTPAPRRRWEFIALLALLALLAVTRFYRLDDLPSGVAVYEGEMVGSAQKMGMGSIAHEDNGDIAWPTLQFYQTWLSAKYLGWRPLAFRVPPAVWSILTILAFFFVARALAGPVAAFAAAWLMAVDPYLLNMSRHIFPGTILMLPPVLAGGLFLVGLRRRRWWWFAMAGFAAGLSLYGYVPGRTIGPLFLGWMAWLYLFRRDIAPRAWHSVLFWAVFLATASWVLHYALFVNPGMYYGYVAGKNPNAGAGPLGYLMTFLRKIPQYAECLVTYGDPDPYYLVPRTPLLNPPVALLFSVGLFLAAAAAWRPAGPWLLAFFLFGMLPAMLGGVFPHPTSRRMVMVVPALYLMVALAVSRYERVLAGPLAAAWRKGVFVLLLAVLGGYSLWNGWNEAFVKLPQNAHFQANDRHHLYLIYADLRDQGYQNNRGTLFTEHFLLLGAHAIAFFPETRINGFSELEDLLRAPAGQPSLWYLPASNLAPITILQPRLPELGLKSYPDPHRLGLDPFEPSLFFFRVTLPKGAIEKARGLELKGAQGWSPAAVFAPEFSQAQRGRELTLRGSLLLPRMPGMVKLGVDWPGWSLNLDGRPLPARGEFWAEGGLHRLELKGRVPATASGPLPLACTPTARPEGPLEPWAVYPWLWKNGLRATFHPGVDGFKQPAVAARNLMFPQYRFEEGVPGEPLPASTVFEGRFTPPSSGDWTFEMPGNNFGEVWLDGKLVFRNLADRKREQPLLRLTQGKSVSLRAEHRYAPGGAAYRFFQLRGKRAGEAEYKVLPPDAFTPPPAQRWSPTPPRAKGA